MFRQPRIRFAPLSALTVLVLLLMGGGSAAAGARAAQANPCEDFDPGKFSSPTTIDNQWFPLQPGTQFIYEGYANQDGERIPHRVVLTVTDLAKEIAGVRTVVVWDRDFSNDTLEETELALFAQDNDKNVWHFGQYPEVYEDGKLAEAPAWIHGIQDARAGITIKADPQVGAPSYCQGWGPAVGWTDRAQAALAGQQTMVRYGSYNDVLITKEFSQEEPNAFQLKYYARGVGNVRVGWEGDDATKETLELVDIVHLSPDAMREVRAQAFELERRAYKVSKDVYAKTTPMEVLSTSPASAGASAQPQLPRTGDGPAQPWFGVLLLALALGLVAAGWLVARRATRS